MTNLSPAAQAIDAAFWKTINDKWNIYDRRRAQLAAALRAAANELTDASSAHTLYAIAGELDDIPHLSLNPKIPTDS
jgi:hypothetical protein